MPYGESFVDEHSSRREQPYKFNGKELDEEVGLYYYGARYYEPEVSVWYGVDKLAEKYPNVGGMVYCLGNPIKLVDADGNTPEERSLALQIVMGLMGTEYNSTFPENNRVKDGRLDCSGLVRFSIMQNASINDPYTNVQGGGVTRIIQKTRQVELNAIRDGDLVVIKSGSNENGHIGFVKDIQRNDKGDVTQYTMLHSEAAWTNESNGLSGGGNINEAIIKVGSERGYAKSKYNHRFFQWDTPETQNNNTNATQYTTNFGLGKESYLNQGNHMKTSEKMIQSKANIVRDIGHLLESLGF
jgi:RHS repeat-associated protein